MKKKALFPVFSGLLIVLLLLVLSPSAFASGGSCGANVTWTLDNRMLTISGTGAMTDYSYYTDVPWRNNTITDVIVEDGVTAIGSWAFYGCSSLDRVTLPTSLREIHSYAFYGTAIESISLEEGLISIGDFVFMNCPDLRSVEFPDSMTSMGYSTFQLCPKLQSVRLPSGLTEIMGYTFISCTSLSHIEIPSGVTRIGEDAFMSCSALTDIMIPMGVTEIGYAAFAQCSSLTRITVPASVSSLYGAVFSNCSRLASICFAHGKDDEITYCPPPASPSVPEMPSAVVYCFRDSVPAAWARYNGNRIEYLDDEDIGSVCTLDLPDELTIRHGQTVSLIPLSDIFPNVDSVIVWSSSDDRFVSVENGVVTGCNIGTVTITATIGGKTDSTEITVISASSCDHQPVIDSPETAPGCLTPGFTSATHCEICGEVLSIAIEIPAGHQPIIDLAVPATASMSGLTEGSHCGVCGVILQDQLVIPPVVEGLDGNEFEDDSGFFYSLSHAVNNANYISYQDNVGRRWSTVDYVIVASYADGSTDSFAVSKTAGQVSGYEYNYQTGNLHVFSASVYSDDTRTDAVIGFELSRPGTVCVTIVVGRTVYKMSRDVYIANNFVRYQGTWAIDFSKRGNSVVDLSSLDRYKDWRLYLESDGTAFIQDNNGFGRSSWTAADGNLTLDGTRIPLFEQGQIAIPLGDDIYNAYKRISENTVPDSLRPYLGTWKAYIAVKESEGITVPVSQLNASVYKTVYLNANKTIIMPVNDTINWGKVTVQNRTLLVNGQATGFSFNQNGQLTRNLGNGITLLYMRFGDPAIPDIVKYSGRWYANRIIRRLPYSDEFISIAGFTDVISLEALIRLDGTVSFSYCGIPSNETWSIQDGVFTATGAAAGISFSSAGELLYPLGNDYYLCCTHNRPATGQALILPASLTEIEEAAFRESSAVRVVLPGTCTTVGPCAFADCALLSLVYIPDSVETIAPSAFDNCDLVFFVCQSDNAGAAFARRNGIGYVIR